MANLFDIDQRLQNLLEVEMEFEGLEEAIKSVQMEETVKLDNIAKMIRSLQADTKSLKEEEKRLKARRESVERNINSLKKYLENYLKFKETSKIKTLNNTFTLANNPKKMIIDDTILEENYMLQEVVSKPNKELIQEILNQGLEIKGVTIEQSQSLRIR